MSPNNYQLFNTWFPAIVVGLVISLVAAVLWDIIRRKTWCFAARFWPGILKEVGLETSCLSRVEVEEKQREVTDMLSALSSQITNALASSQPLMAGNIDSAAAESSNSGSSVSLNCDSDIEAQPMINPLSTPTGKSITFTATVRFPGDTPNFVIHPVKKFLKRHSKVPIKRWKSSIVLQASLPIEPCVLAEIGVLAKSCMHNENQCIFQLGNWAILYYNAGEVHLHILKEGDVPVNLEARWEDESITMRGLNLNGAQVKVATKRTSTTLRSAGPATQRPGELDELDFPSGELYVPGEDFLIFAAKIVEANGTSFIVRSEASFIHPQRGSFALTEVIWSLLRRIPQCAKKVTQLFLNDEDGQPEISDSRPELRFGQQHLELILEHWKGASEIELLEKRNEVLHYLHELRKSGIVDGASSQPLDTHLHFIRDVEYWQKGLQDVNEVILQSTGRLQSGTHIHIRGGMKFLCGDFESALQDLDLAYGIMREHSSTVLVERALAKCMLARYSEALEDVGAVIAINPNENNIQELQTCIQQILDPRIPNGRIHDGQSSCHGPRLSEQDNRMATIPDLLTGDEWHSGKSESPCTMSDDITGGGWIVDWSSMHGKSTALAQPRDVAMAFKVDTSAIQLQLKQTNYAEALERNRRYYVRRISFIANILEEVCGTDDVVEPLSAEDQEVLKWQAGTGNLQDDVEVRSSLTSMSGRFFPYKSISLSLFDKVSDDETHQQRTGQYPLSSYRHVSFRSAMLTKYREKDLAPDGEVEPLVLYDGLPGDLSSLRWRSHDYIKLCFSEARPSYRVVWLVQWDIVDLQLEPISDGLDATTGRGIMNRRSCLDHSAVPSEGDSTGKFHGIRRCERGKSPWIAEVTLKGERRRDKIWLGSYKTAAAAARAVDAAYYYYNLQNRYNFLDSPSFLEEIPRDLDDKAMEDFVRKEARRLASLTEMLSLISIPENRCDDSISEGLSSSQVQNISSGNNFGSDNMQAAANANFAGLPRSDSFLPPSMESGRGVKANLDVQPSGTSYGSGVLGDTVGSSREENLGPNDSFAMFGDIIDGGLTVDLSSMHAKSTYPARPRDPAMAFELDRTPIKSRLKLTNYAESLETEPRFHVTRISFIITILDDECVTDDVVEPSAEARKVLNWQAGTGNRQDDVEVRSELTYLSGRLCPYKNISLSLFDKVSDDETHQQRTGQYPLSSYQHHYFRSAMLTKHSAPDGEVEPLLLFDGLPEALSSLRWRPHDYIKLGFSEARPSYRLFWLAQWDIVDLQLEPVGDGLDATTGRGIMNRRSCLDHSAVPSEGDSTGKFHGIRRCERGKRKPPWIAEVTLKGERRRDKIWLGSYKTAAAAARAVDAAYYYYNLQNRYNFLDSPSFLEEIPRDLDDKAMEDFVRKEARRLASLTEMLSLISIPENRCDDSISEGLSSSQVQNISSGNNFGSDNMQAAANANFAGLPRSDSFLPPSMESGRGVKANLDVQPSGTSYGSGVLGDTVGSSREENLGQSISNASFTTNSQLSEGVFNPKIDRASICDSSLIRGTNYSLDRATNDVLNLWDENSETAWDENSESLWDEKSDTVWDEISETAWDENRETNSDAPQEWDTVERPKLPCTSRDHGVRFRSFLRKWVEEIRVAEWQISGCLSNFSPEPQSKLGPSEPALSELVQHHGENRVEGAEQVRDGYSVHYHRNQVHEDTDQIH